MNLDLFQEIMRDDYGQKMTMYDNSRVFTPEKIAKQMVDMLPDQVWDPKTKFLDPCCKTGVFLIEIYNKLDEALQKLPEYGDKSKRRNHILNNQIFGIALDDESLVYSRRNVAGDIFYENIQYLPQFMRYVKNKDYTEIKKLLKQEEVFKMDKFDVVIGNPPYQSASNRSSIYPKFVELGINVADKLCMITRDNWLNGKAFKDMRNNLISRGGVHDIIHYPVVGEIFQSVQVSVQIFYWTNKSVDKTHYICIRDGEKTSDRYIDIENAIFYKNKCSEAILDKLKSNKRWTDVYNTRSYPFMDQRKRYSLSSVEKRDNTHNILVISNDGYFEYVGIDNFKNVDDVLEFNVLCGVIVNEASVEKPGNVLTNILVIKPYQVQQETWSLIASFRDEDMALNCEKYIKTRLVRFVANQQVNGRSGVTDNTFSLVPLQDFTSDSDIDWSKSVDEIDKQLYKKYNLTQEEIDYIEKTIKPMK